MWQSNEHILVVDHDEVVREEFAKRLNQIGYKCMIAGSAEDAIRVLQQEEFALLLLDFSLPGKSGLPVLPEVTRRYPDMAIMVSGRDDPTAIVLAMREGAYDYLTKPVPEVLRATGAAVK